MSRLPPLRIDAIAHGGDGVASLPSGKKVFVSGVAPGDLVEAELVRERPQQIHARLSKVLEPGPARIVPPCRHAAACGGCQLQQVEPAAQLQVKERAFYESLERLGSLPRSAIPKANGMVPSPAAFRYRIRARLAVRGGRLVGYLERASHRLVELEECLLLEPSLERLVLALGARLRRTPIRHLAAIEACIGEEGQGAVALEPEPEAPSSWGQGAEALLSLPGLQGLVVLPPAGKGSGRGARGQPRIFGDPQVLRRAALVDGLTLPGRPDAFAQANAEANEALVRLALEGMEVEAGDRVLELFSGAGNFSFPLAAMGASVTAVEGAGVSLEIARQVRARASLAGTLRFIAGDALEVTKGFAQEGRRFDGILLDPPRAGAKGLAPSLAALAPRRIVYVSCNPASLARDLVELGQAGYELLEVTPLDMFPQTFHVEAVAVLEPREGPRPGLSRRRGT